MSERGLNVDICDEENIKEKGQIVCWNELKEDFSVIEVEDLFILKSI